MAKLSTKLVSTLILSIIILVIIFQVIADTGGDVGAVAGNLTCTDHANIGCLSANASGVDGGVAAVLPFTSFFKKKGVILLAFIAGVVIVVLVAVLGIGKSKG